MQIAFPNKLINEYTYNDKILSSLECMIKHYVAKHGKTLVVRFDIKYPLFYTEEVRRNDISSCMQKVIQAYKRKKYDPMYCWVAEQDSSVHPHFHCVILLDGNKTQNPYHVFQTVESLWGSTIGVAPQGLVHHCFTGKSGNIHENGIMLRRADDNFSIRLQDVYAQVSYIAKSQGKGDYNDGMRDFGMSRLK